MFDKKNKKQNKKTFYIIFAYVIFLACFVLIVLALVYSARKFNSLTSNNGRGLLVEVQNQSMGCQYWEKNRPYQGQAELLRVSQVSKLTGAMEVFNDTNLNFSYPGDLVVSKIIDQASGQTIFYFGKDEQIPRAFSLVVGNRNSFVDYYTQCYQGCLRDCSANENFCRQAQACAESYSKQNLDKILSGLYINYINTGAYPPGGVSSYIFSQVVGEKVVQVIFNSETIVDYGFKLDDLLDVAPYMIKSFDFK